MIKAAGETGATMIHDLATAIIHDSKVPTDWEQSFIVCLYKGKGDALDRGNYRGIKLTKQAMKILERTVDGLLRQVVSIDDSQFGYDVHVCGAHMPYDVFCDHLTMLFWDFTTGQVKQKMLT